MSEPVEAPDLIVSFPAGGAGGSTLEQLERLADRKGSGYVALSNPASAEDLASGQWQAQSTDTVRRAAVQSAAGRIILVGHCMGGLSALRLADGLGSATALPVGVLAVNTPCPDLAGRIPTMSRFSDGEIAELLAGEGFPQDLLDDEDMLAEIADGLRADAAVADRLAEWVNSVDDLENLHVLSTRGDTFIPPEQCAAWRHRVSGEFQLTIAPGGHAIDEASIGLLERAIDSIKACVQPDPV
ncbi:MAG: thioesterase II family protein [Jatrophihabitans sp.]